jgi:hypothetical protein
MSMLTTLDAIAKTLSRKSPSYDRGRTRHRALAPYETPAAAAAAVRADSRAPLKERERILTALVEEHQLEPSPVWQSLLLLGFQPLLVRLRSLAGACTHRDRARTDEDRDQDVLVAFLDGVRTVRAGAYTTLGVRWATEARLAAALRPPVEDRRTEEHDDEEDHEEDDVAEDDATARGASRARGPLAPSVTEAISPEAGADLKLEVSEVLGELEARAGRDVVEALIATEIGGETLVEYVARVHPRLEPEGRARMCTRLSRARADAVDRLRPRFAERLARAA